MVYAAEELVGEDEVCKDLHVHCVISLFYSCTARRFYPYENVILKCMMENKVCKRNNIVELN